MKVNASWPTTTAARALERPDTVPDSSLSTDDGPPRVERRPGRSPKTVPTTTATPRAKPNTRQSRGISSVMGTSIGGLNPMIALLAA